MEPQSTSDAQAIIEMYKGKHLDEVPKCLEIDCSIPDPPSEKLSKTQLSPQIHSYTTNTREEALDSKLQEFCMENPIVIIHDLAKVLQLDLELFSTKALVKANPRLQIEIREQMKSGPDEHSDESQRRRVWKCMSQHKVSTIKSYAKYQTKYLKKQKVRHGNSLTSDSSDRETDSSENEAVKFATNVDLSVSSKKWRRQLKELAKLPPFLKATCKDVNMLSHVEFDILGMNTVQGYMKVPGCKTTGHQENNNFCSVNINIGPGDCEWFGVPYEYWGVIYSLCEQNDVDYLRDSWWPPNLDVLHERNVPVYRFFQKPGDVVWVNVGCVHWVQAIGCCNNIAWNVGPLTVKQYQLAMERYEFNKQHRYQSIVPMVYLSWQLASEAKVSDPELFRLIKNCLMQTLKEDVLMLQFIESKKVEVIHDEELSHKAYCVTCLIEVFNILICKKNLQKNEYIVYCLNCALEESSSLMGFTCLKRMHTNRLTDIYDEFIRH